MGASVFGELEEKLNEFAHALIDAAKGDEVPLDTKLDCFRVVSQHWLATVKVGKTEEKPDADIANFDAFRQKVAAAGKGE